MKATDESAAVLAKLAKARIEKGFSLREVAERMGSAREYVSAVEHGRNDPGLAWLLRYMRALGLRLSYLDVVQ